MTLPTGRKHRRNIREIVGRAARNAVKQDSREARMKVDTFECERCSESFDFRREVEEHLVFNHNILRENYRVEKEEATGVRHD